MVCVLRFVPWFDVFGVVGGLISVGLYLIVLFVVWFCCLLCVLVVLVVSL